MCAFWESQTFSSGSLLLPKCVMIKSTARLTDLSKPGGRAEAEAAKVTDCVLTSQGWKCEGEERRNPGFPQRSSDALPPFISPSPASAKCHGEFLPRAGAALQSCISARGGEGGGNHPPPNTSNLPPRVFPQAGDEVLWSSGVLAPRLFPCSVLLRLSHQTREPGPIPCRES